MNATDELETLQIPTEEDHGFDPYSFMGMDGETYHVGKTPLTFLTEMRNFFNASVDNLEDIDVETVAKWMWAHMRSVEGQRHLTQEDVANLLFYVDVPVYFSMIFRRAAEAQLEQNKFKETVEQIPKDIRRINSMIDSNNRYTAAKKIWEQSNGFNNQERSPSDVHETELIPDHTGDGQVAQEGIRGEGEPDITVLPESISTD